MAAMDAFRSRHGLGRNVVTGVCLGAAIGAHAAAAPFVSPAAQTWCCYVVAVAVFHTLEFVWAAQCVMGMGWVGGRGSPV